MASEFNEREHFALFHTFFIFSKCLQSLVCVRAKMCVCARNKRFVCHLWMCKCASVCAYWCYSRYVTKCKLAEREKNEQSGQNCCKEMNKISCPSTMSTSSPKSNDNWTINALFPHMRMHQTKIEILINFARHQALSLRQFSAIHLSICIHNTKTKKFASNRQLLFVHFVYSDRRWK